MGKTDMAELGLDRHKNDLIRRSNSLVNEIEKVDERIDSTYKIYKDVFKNYINGKKKKGNTNTSSLDVIINNSINLLDTTISVTKPIINELKRITSGIEFETWENDEHELIILKKLISSDLNSILKQFNNEITSGVTYLKSNSKLFNPTTLELTKGFKAALSQRAYLLKLCEILNVLIKKVEFYVEYKKKEESLSSIITKKGIVRGSLQYSKQKGVGGFYNSAKRNIYGKLGIDEHDDKKTKARKIGGLALAATGFTASVFLKSSGIGVATGAYLLKRKNTIDTNRELYKKNINNIENQKNNIKKVIVKAKKDRADFKIKEALKGDKFINSFAGGGSVTAKKDSTVLVAERKIGNSVVPEKVKTSFGLNKKFTKPTLLNLPKGESASVEPDIAGGTTSYDKSSLKPSGRFAGGTKFDGESISNPEAISNPIVDAIDRQTEESRLFHNQTLADAADAANRAKSPTSSMIKFDKNLPETKKEDKKGLIENLLGFSKDGLKTALGAAIAAKVLKGNNSGGLFGRDAVSGNVGTGRNVLRGGLALGAGAGVGYGAYKGTNALLGVSDEAEAQDKAENGGENSLGYKAKKYGSMAVGAVSGIGTSFLANKYLKKTKFFGANSGSLLGGAGSELDMMQKSQTASKVGATPVYVVNANEIGGDSNLPSISDLIPDKKIGVPTHLSTNTKGFFGKALDYTKGVGGSITEGVSGLGGKALNLVSKMPGGALATKMISKYGVRGIPLVGGALAAGASYANTKASGGGTGEAIGGAVGGTAGGVVGTALGALGANPATVMAGSIGASLLFENIGKKIGKMFDTQNKTQEDIDKEEQDNRLGFWDKLSSSENPLLKGIGNVVNTAKNIASTGYTAYKEARESGSSFTGALGKGIGAVSQMFESGKSGAGMVSSGKGDFGGKSYGTYQLSSTQGSVNSFLNKSGYASAFKGLQVGTPEFDNKWKDLAKNDKNFSEAQNSYAADKYAKPQLSQLEKMGVNTKDRAIQEMAMSTGVQYGEGLGGSVFKNALKGQDVSKMSSKDIVTLVQDYKAAHVQDNFKKSSPAVQAGVAKRIQKEKNVLLSLTGQPVGDNVAQAQNNKASYIGQIDSQAAAQSDSVSPETKQFLQANGYNTNTPKAKSTLASVPKTKTPDRIKVAQTEISMTKEMDRQRTIEKEKKEKEIQNALLANSYNNGNINISNTSNNQKGSNDNMKITTSDNSMLGMYASLLGRV